MYAASAAPGDASPVVQSNFNHFALSRGPAAVSTLAVQREEDEPATVNLH